VTNPPGILPSIRGATRHRVNGDTVRPVRPGEAPPPAPKRAEILPVKPHTPKMPDNSQEKSGANAELDLKKWRATPDALEGLERYQLRALRAAETAMYQAAEEGDREGVLAATNQLNKCVAGYRKLFAEQRARERKVTEREVFEMLDELMDGLIPILRRHDVPDAAVRDVFELLDEPEVGNGAAPGGPA